MHFCCKNVFICIHTYTFTYIFLYFYIFIYIRLYLYICIYLYLFERVTGQLGLHWLVGLFLGDIIVKSRLSISCAFLRFSDQLETLLI